jgi:hypothetical protein
MKAWETPVGVALGAGVIVTSDVVTLMDSCENTEGIEANARNIETRILAHMEPRSSSGLTGMWV